MLFIYTWTILDLFFICECIFHLRLPDLKRCGTELTLRIESHELRRCMDISYVYTVHMSPALNGSSVLQRFKYSNVIDEIKFDFYPRLPHM